MRILIADDDPISLKMLSYTLSRWGYDVTSCSNGIDAIRLLLDEGIRLAILDWEMPEMNGIDVVRMIRSSPNRNAYLVLLSAKTRQADVITGLEAGADDFIRKPFDAGELQARLNTGNRIIRLEETLKEQSIRDALTGLYNRRYMEETLERELRRAKRRERRSRVDPGGCGPL
jgi:DNA-binding response OmpR family regulator